MFGISVRSFTTCFEPRRIGLSGSSHGGSPRQGGSSSTCSDEGVSDVAEEVHKPVADLSQTQLDAFFDAAETSETSYDRNGMSTSRIKGVIKKGCKCSRACVKSLSVTSLTAACRGFWRLRKEAQDAVLWSLCRASGGKRTWKLNGTILCRPGFCKALGIGIKRINRVTRTFRGKDLRGP